MTLKTSTNRSMKTPTESMTIANVYNIYNLSFLVMQETHLAGRDAVCIKTSDGKKKCTVHNSGTMNRNKTRAGVAILKCAFTTVAARLCMLKIILKLLKHLKHYHQIYTNANILREKSRNMKKTFYSALTLLVNTLCKKAIFTIMGDFNAGTTS